MAETINRLIGNGYIFAVNRLDFLLTVNRFKQLLVIIYIIWKQFCIRLLKALHEVIWHIQGDNPVLYFDHVVQNYSSYD